MRFTQNFGQHPNFSSTTIFNFDFELGNSWGGHSNSGGHSWGGSGHNGNRRYNYQNSNAGSWAGNNCRIQNQSHDGWSNQNGGQDGGWNQNAHSNQGQAQAHGGVNGNDSWNGANADQNQGLLPLPSPIDGWPEAAPAPTQELRAGANEFTPGAEFKPSVKEFTPGAKEFTPAASGWSTNTSTLGSTNVYPKLRKWNSSKVAAAVDQVNWLKKKSPRKKVDKTI